MEGALALAVVLAFIWGRQYLKLRKRHEEREMLHRERLLAMEKGIPLPEFPTLAEEPSGSLLDYMSGSMKDVIPKLTLGCGLILIFGGAGMVAAFLIAPDSELHKAWSVGLIPAFIGVGFILYYLFIRRLER
jgi:Domain of unknown function (DUF6249)